jgi:hypothetical protein
MVATIANLLQFLPGSIGTKVSVGQSDRIVNRRGRCGPG